LLGLNSEKFCFSVSIQCPWEAIKCKKGEAVKLLVLFLGLVPLLAVDEGLLLEVYIFVKSIIIELSLLNLHRTASLLVGLLKNIEHFDDIHDHILFEYIFDDHNCDILLKL
jgi:hypothetical protein